MVRPKKSATGGPSPSSSPQGSASVDHDIPSDSVVKVFHQKLLLEKILEHAIHNAIGKLSPKMVTAVRSVNKSWLEATSKVLIKLEEPVITLDETYLPSNIYEPLYLMIFTQVFSYPMRRYQRFFLPLKLTIGRGFFRRENYPAVVELLRQTGGELLELQICYPSDGLGMPFVSFPKLRKLVFQFSDDDSKETPSSSSSSKSSSRFNFGDYNHNQVCSLNYILCGSEGLKELVIPFSKKVPEGIQCVRLPDTLVSLKLELRLRSAELEALVLQLSKLEHLKLQTHKIPFEDGFMFKILERFRETLKSFHVSGLLRFGVGHRHPVRRSYLQFPVMEKLEIISLRSVEIELALAPSPSQIFDLKTCLPKLNRLELTYQTEPMLWKWMENFQSDQVKEMTLSVIDEQLKHDDVNFYVSIKPEMMEKVKHGFPNLRVLTLDLNLGGDMSCLKYMFENMKGIKSLQINFRGEIERDGYLKMESIFLGYPVEVLRALQYFKTFEMKDDQQTGIINLSELEILILWTENWKVEEPENERVSLISNLFFDQLVKMEKLRDLHLYGKFKPSEEMQAKWEEKEDRCIDYSPEFIY